MMNEKTTVDDLLKTKDVPVVAIDQGSLFTFVNDAFTQEYGWTIDDLLGKSVVEIMPDHMRSGHNIGFSRFLATEKSELLNKYLPLKVKYKDGREMLANHFIVGDKKNNKWRFAAVIDYPNKNAAI
ncbi:MAG: PAS domain S-box protein [Candidatus Saccharimonadales bacterium]